MAGLRGRLVMGGGVGGVGDTEIILESVGADDKYFSSFTSFSRGMKIHLGQTGRKPERKLWEKNIFGLSPFPLLSFVGQGPPKSGPRRLKFCPKNQSFIFFHGQHFNTGKHSSEYSRVRQWNR